MCVGGGALPGTVFLPQHRTLCLVAVRQSLRASRISKHLLAYTVEGRRRRAESSPAVGRRQLSDLSSPGRAADVERLQLRQAGGAQRSQHTSRAAGRPLVAAGSSGGRPPTRSRLGHAVASGQAARAGGVRGRREQAEGQGRRRRAAGSRGGVQFEVAAQGSLPVALQQRYKQYMSADRTIQAADAQPIGAAAQPGASACRPCRQGGV
jgi:hypothetical protein